jgi:hypothetical protein
MTAEETGDAHEPDAEQDSGDESGDASQQAADGANPVEETEILHIPVAGETVEAIRHGPVSSAAPKPVVLIYIPYHKDDFAYSGGLETVERLLEAGYVAVVADMVGTGGSTGRFDEPFAPSEGEHGAAVVEWLADREWSTGSVGVTGKSYPGTTALEIAEHDPRGLEAIVPVHAPFKPYTSYYEPGGLAFYRTAGSWAPNFELLAVQPPAGKRDGEWWADVWTDRLDRLEERDPFLFQYLDHPTEDAYWTDKAVVPEDIRVPTLAVGGYRDVFAADTVEYCERIAGPTKLVLGPYRHVMPSQGRQGRFDFLALAIEWFDHHLRGEDTGVEDWPAIRYFTESEGGDPAAGQWRAREEWPRSTGATDGPAATHGTGSGGGAGESDGPDEAAAAAPGGLSLALGPDGLTLDSGAPAGSIAAEHEVDHTTGADSLGFEVGAGRPLRTDPDDARSLTFETGPLDAPVEFTGTGHADLHVTAAVEDPLLAVRVVDVDPDGRGTLVTHGVVGGGRPGADAATTDGDGPTGDSGAPTDPPQQVRVPLRPRSYLFQPDHRIRVAVSGAFFPFVRPQVGHDRFTLHSSPETPSRIVFPGRELSPAGLEETALDLPAADEPEAAGEQHWATTRDHLADTVTVETGSEYTREMPHATYTHSQEIEATVQAEAPESATIDRTSRTVVDFGTESVETTVEVWMDAAMAGVTYEVERDGVTIVSETKRWSRDRE